MRMGLSDWQQSAFYRAFGHPVRARAFQLLCEGPASPSDLTAVLDEEIGTVSYHVRVLAREGLIERVETRPGRGTARVYDVTAEARSGVLVLDEVAWRQLLAEAEVLFTRARELEAEAVGRAGGTGRRADRFAVAVVVLPPVGGRPA
jgi:DNA-binding transcriptional ArsR family regulator